MLGGCCGLFSLYQLAGFLFAKPYLSAVGAGGEGERASVLRAPGSSRAWGRLSCGLCVCPAGGQSLLPVQREGAA